MSLASNRLQPDSPADARQAPPVLDSCALIATGGSFSQEYRRKLPRGL